MDLFEIIKNKMELEEITITDYSPLTLAYIGDGIYEIIIRTVIVDEANRQVNKIHKAASNLVKAQECINVWLQSCNRFWGTNGMVIFNKAVRQNDGTYKNGC